MSVNPFAGLLRMNGHNGRSGALSERDVRLQIYGDHPTDEVSALPRVAARQRDARGRFLPASAKERAGR